MVLNTVTPNTFQYRGSDFRIVIYAKEGITPNVELATVSLRVSTFVL